MPELYFRVRWPDGGTQCCHSPSTVVDDYFGSAPAPTVAAVLDVGGSGR